jgi:hypothetical protein
MIEIISAILLISGFTFIVSGLCFANSIEAKNNKIVENILLFLSIGGMIVFLICMIIIVIFFMI